MARQHLTASPTVSCIWPAEGLFDEVAERLICWAGQTNVKVSTSVTQHYEVEKALCGTFGPLTFTDGGPDQCPLPDDINVAVATGLDVDSCLPEPPPGATPATQEGTNTFSGLNFFTDTVEIDQPDAASIGLIIKQPNTVISTDANMLEVFYKTFNTLRLNELGLLRVLAPPLSTGLGKEGETTAQFHAGTSTSKAVRILDHAGAENAFIRGNGTATFLGNVDAPNITKGAWTAITIDSTTTPGRYVAGTGVTAYAPAARIVGGDMVQLSGSITINSASVTGDIMASAMPAGTFPAKEINVLGGSGGAAAMIRVSAAGALTIQRSAQVTSISLDGITYRLA